MKSYKINCCHFSTQEKVNTWAQRFDDAFSLSSNIYHDSQGYGITTSYISDADRAEAIHHVLTNEPYNVIVDNGYGIKSYHYSRYSDAQQNANYFSSAFNVHASVYTDSGKYGIYIRRISSTTKTNAMHEIIGTGLYNQLIYEEVNDGKTISMPVNCNQKKDPNDWLYNNGCAVCCGVDVTSYYGNRDYTINDLRPYYTEDDNGYSWYSPTCYFEKHSETNISQCLAIIRQEIDNNRPVCVHCIRNHTGLQHWVVAYGYSGAGNTTSLIQVLDPAGDNYASSGKFRTLYEAMDKNYKVFGIRELSLTSAK